MTKLLKHTAGWAILLSPAIAIVGLHTIQHGIIQGLLLTGGIALVMLILSFGVKLLSSD